MIKLKDEIKRVEAVKGNVVPVSKQLYLNLLKEIKLLESSFERKRKSVQGYHRIIV